MGTRHLVMVILDGEFKVAQYGQWDGYPKGAGVEVVNFILNVMDKKKFIAALRECTWVTRERLSQLYDDFGSKNGYIDLNDSKRMGEAFPAFSRDTSSDILKLIQDGGIRELDGDHKFAADSHFCEWAYVLDMDKDILEVYEGFNKKPLKETERFASYKTEKDSEYQPIKLLKAIPFSELADFDLAGLNKE